MGAGEQESGLRDPTLCRIAGRARLRSGDPDGSGARCLPLPAGGAALAAAGGRRKAHYRLMSFEPAPLRPAGSADILRPVAAGRRRACLLAALLCLAGAAPALAQERAQPKLPMVEIQAGIHLIRAEVADDFKTRQVGLMFRERLGPNEGMLFVFQEPGVQCFWMRNTLIPLSIAFIDDDGTIANIADMQARTEDSHCSARPVRFALEMDQGWFAKRGLKAGVRLASRVFAPPASR